MRTLQHRLRTAVASFWLVPALLLAAAALLAELLVGLDRRFGTALDDLPFVSGIGASGSRDLLAAIGGSMLGVAATSFSITISVIATASSTYGPRLVRNFMANRGNQVVLGIFGPTFLYALLVLRTVREEAGGTSAFVPHLAVTVAIVFAVADVAVLVYFVHHIADSIQVATLAAQTLAGLQLCLTPEGPEPSLPAGPLAPEAATLRARDHGFLQYVDRAALMATAESCGAVVRLRLRVGDHVIAGDALLTLHPDGAGGPAPALDDALADRLRRHLTFGRARTPEQDVRHAVQQLVELAVRALSPSTNDPYTAINAIVELGTGLAPLVAADDAPDGYARDGRLRLVEPPLGVVEVVDLAFDQLRPFACDSAEVVLAVLDLASVLERHTHRADVREALEASRASLLRMYLATGPDERDRRRVLVRTG